MKFKRALMLGSIFLALIVLVSALIVYIAQIRTSTHRPAGSSSTPTPVPSTPIPTPNTPFDGYGVYENCSLNKNIATCFSHLDDMAAAGFKLVINYPELYGDASSQKAYLDHAQSVGMKVIIALNKPELYNGKDLSSVFPNLVETCNCSNNRDFIRYVVNLVKNHPALWGYYIGDEVDPANHDAMKSGLADVVHQTDPTHPRLFIDSPGHPIGVWHQNSPFFDTAEVIGTDFYPIRDNSPQYPTLGQAGTVASGTQAYANAHREDSAMVLQAFSYSNYNIPGTPYPTADQMEYTLSQTLTYSHPRMILWYSYYDTMSSDNPTQHWSDLKSINARNTPQTTRSLQT
jgi:hypothetical protein